MASKLSLAFLLLVFVSILSQPTISIVAQTNHHDHGLNVGMISSALSNKGYIAMSLILEQTLPILIPFKVTYNTTITIFCPQDKAFLFSKYPQPPFTLLQYHVAPLKLDREALHSSLLHESKVDTLLPQHLLVVTTTRHNSDCTSINGVKVTDWDIYNDGHVIVHGVKDFFDLAFETLLYPGSQRMRIRMRAELERTQM
ncbi:putative fasciclin-like arabinogalactan protein 20 [Camellia lanceoleosa]|uniref:Fasciclin-like arabinogalactan protein 20 n=1 Tax=Camellia lanceoleosa TaxID=1840588 RepID=A0ACC0H4D8_9ERIC|nr:putative fasciclin-like arabinogalactan protein 20 [Camellia lanceoleosa]